MTITIPAELEARIDEEARQRGTTPELLAVDTLRQAFVPVQPDVPAKGETLFDSLGDFIGAVEGSGEPLSEDCGRHFADIVVEKHRRARR